MPPSRVQNSAEMGAVLTSPGVTRQQVIERFTQIRTQPKQHYPEGLTIPGSVPLALDYMEALVSMLEGAYLGSTEQQDRIQVLRSRLDALVG